MGGGEAALAARFSWTFNLSRGAALSPPGHLALPEGSDEEKDCALRHGQLGSVEPGPVLPHALQGIGDCLKGTSGCTHVWPACTSCPGAAFLAVGHRPRAGAASAMHRAALMMYQSRLGPRFYLLPSSPLYLARCGTRALPGPWKMKPKPTLALSFKVLDSLL